MSNQLLNRLVIVFGMPESIDPPAYLSEIARLLRAYSHAELDKAADLLVREFVPTARKPWPTPNEVCIAAADARDILTPPKTADDKHPAWSDSAMSFADKAIVSDLGREAADNGWIGALHDFYRHNKRQPNAAEIYKCKIAAKDMEDGFKLSMTSNNRATRAFTDLDGIGTTMMANRAKYADMAHGVAP
jgi:hypothetical protein